MPWKTVVSDDGEHLHHCTIISNGWISTVNVTILKALNSSVYIQFAPWSQAANMIFIYEAGVLC
jgi:hypothetical protein